MKEPTVKDFEDWATAMHEEVMGAKKPIKPKGVKGIHISGDKKHQRYRDKAEILRTPIQGYDYTYLDGLEDMIREDHVYQFSTFKDLRDYLLKLKLEEDPDWEKNRDFERMMRDI